MKTIYFHRWWLAAILFALLFIVCGNSLLYTTHKTLEQRIAHLEKEKNEILQSLENLRADALEAERLKNEMGSEEISLYLVPPDRRQISAQFEPLAASSRLNHFTYTLSPEQQIELPDMNGLAQSALALEADAPHDGNVYSFLKKIMAILPGRAQINSLNIELLNSRSNTPLAATNVHISALLTWLTNKSEKDVK